MSEIMREKIDAIVPNTPLSQLYMTDVQGAVFKAFEELGYEPSKNIHHNMDKVWANSNRADPLSEFVYNVWSEDK